MKYLKWKKILVGLGIVTALVIITSLIIGWPINTFPTIQGKILDATTGEPIENVVVSVNWIKSSPGPAGEITRTIRSDVAVTDKEGKYHIPGLWSFHLLSVFSRGYIGFNHPLYGSKQAVVARERRKIIIGSPALKAYPEEFEYRKGVIHYDIELLSLEDNFLKAVNEYKLQIKKEQISQEEKDKLIKEKDIRFMPYYGGISEMVKYFRNLMNRYGLRYDLDVIVTAWESLGVQMFGRDNKWFQKEIKDIKMAITQLKEKEY